MKLRYYYVTDWRSMELPVMLEATCNRSTNLPRRTRHVILRRVERGSLAALTLVFRAIAGDETIPRRPTALSSVVLTGCAKALYSLTQLLNIGERKDNRQGKHRGISPYYLPRY